MNEKYRTEGCLKYLYASKINREVRVNELIYFSMKLSHKYRDLLFWRIWSELYYSNKINIYEEYRCVGGQRGDEHGGVRAIIQRGHGPARVRCKVQQGRPTLAAWRSESVLLHTAAAAVGTHQLYATSASFGALSATCSKHKLNISSTRMKCSWSLLPRYKFG